MTTLSNTKQLRRTHRHARVRARIHGARERPRLAVFRSLKHIYVQIIDDRRGVTLVAASDTELDRKKSANVEIAREVGKLIARRAQDAQIAKVVFDRGGHAYHGQVRALAEGAREGGLEF